MENKIIITDNLSIGYFHKKEEKSIASGITISLEKKKLIALIGANGIGKSTLLRTLIGIQKPLSGKVYFENQEIHDFSPLELAQKLSVVLTEKLPPSNLTVFELIALGRQPYTNWMGKLTKNDLKKINAAVTLTDISHLLEKRHYEISDGQLQKVLIARALAQDTQVIILDEPTTHLDLQHKATLFKLLKKLTSETEKCILFSTHDMDLALQLSDEIIVMTNQGIVQDKPQNIINSGILNRLFPDESIIFDIEKGKFLFKDN